MPMTQPDTEDNNEPKRNFNLNLKVPADIWASVEERQAEMPGWLITDVVEDAIDQYCDWHEAVYLRDNGKPMADRPSGRAGQMARGPGAWRDRDTPPDRVPCSIMTTTERYERFYKVAWHQRTPHDYPARALADALELWLKVNPA